MEWDELRMDRIIEIRASRRDAIAGGLRVDAKCEQVDLDGTSFAISWIIHIDDPLQQHWSFCAGVFGGKQTAARAMEKLKCFGEGTYFAHAHPAARRIAADLHAALIAKFAGTLFRVLRRRAFQRAVLARVRAKLLLSSVAFSGLPEVAVHEICSKWL